METFLAVYTGTTSARERSGWDSLDPAERSRLEQSGMQAWNEWMAANESCIAYAGGPVGKTKRVSRDGVQEVSNALVGFVVLQAESHEAAAARFENHPHFAIFPGEAVEIMPCLPIPGG